MPRFVKMPVEIEAWQWNPPGIANIPDWTLEALDAGKISRPDLELGDEHQEMQLAIHTLEGVMTASPGDWIIKGVAGEIYPCKPDIFAATYRPAAPVMEGFDPDGEMEKALGEIIGHVVEVDPKTHPRGEPLEESEYDLLANASEFIERASRLFAQRIMKMAHQITAEGEHTAAAQATIERLEAELKDARRNATGG